MLSHIRGQSPTKLHKCFILHISLQIAIDAAFFVLTDACHVQLISDINRLQTMLRSILLGSLLSNFTVEMLISFSLCFVDGSTYDGDVGGGCVKVIVN